MRTRVRRYAFAVGVWLLPATAIAQQGTIAGTVTDKATNNPVPSAQVTIVGSTRGTLTGDKGEYVLRAVAPGVLTLRATRIGYAASTQTVTVPASGTVTADFALTSTPSKLDEIVVSASGEQETKREQPVSIGTINMGSVNLAPVNSFSELLTARTPGVVAMSDGGTLGAGTRIRIRGSNSVSLDNDPLIIIDGVRANGNEGSSTIGVGGQVPSRLDDINPEDIETINVIKGPAASSLYGTAAANGVIQITTKRGANGKQAWSAHVAGGTVSNYIKFPSNYGVVDVEGGDTVFSQATQGAPCITEFQAAGFCTYTGLQSFNPLETNSPFVTGNTQSYGLAVSGGSDAMTYYLSGQFDKDQGVYEINKLRHATLRANATAHLGPKFDLTVNSSFGQNRLRLPQNDNNVRGVIPSGILGLVFDDSVNHGYQFQQPVNIFAINTQQNTERYTGSATATWRPLSWLSVLGVTGLDFANRIDQELIPTYLDNGITSRFADDSLGNRTSNPFQTFIYTLNTSATATYGLRPGLSGSTTIGTQYSQNYAHGTFAFGKVLAPGTGSLNGATQAFAVGESTNKDIILGAYGQEQLNWRDRVYLSGTLRADKNNAFGRNFKSIVYPGGGISWVIGNEDFFPKQKFISDARLRAAYGQSGQQPGFRDAVAFYAPVAIHVGSEDVASFTAGNLGDPNLKPERTGETELGFEANLWKDIFAVDFTWYNKKTTDALIKRQLPLSNGVQQLFFQNIGSVQNKGVEMSLTGTPIKGNTVAWDFTISGSHNTNKVLNLGVPPIIFGDQRHQNGYPLGGYWARPYTFQDINGDGAITTENCPGAGCELTLGDTAVYLGSPFPSWDITLGSGITLFKYVRVAALLNRRTGNKLLNFTEDFRCSALLICKALNQSIDPSVKKTSSLADQAAGIAAMQGTDAGYIEDGSFWKIREISLTFSAPDQLAHRFGVSGLSLTLAGRNLGTWTKYKGLDPEINENGGLNFSTDEFLSQPPVRTYTVRMDIHW
ncbi:MAG: SusC/RagA family TonB-linked outer membrane protein [Gemmatimonadaceae bacterium]|nr:SusC/RagA family TonB-linked outer membrane protein [Gemmatimonadaceae bacterium]